MPGVCVAEEAAAPALASPPEGVGRVPVTSSAGPPSSRLDGLVASADSVPDSVAVAPVSVVLHARPTTEREIRPMVWRVRMEAMHPDSTDSRGFAHPFARVDSLRRGRGRVSGGSLG